MSQHLHDDIRSIPSSTGTLPFEDLRINEITSIMLRLVDEKDLEMTFLRKQLVSLHQRISDLEGKK